MAAQANGSPQSDSSAPISRRKMLRAGAAATVSLAAGGMTPGGSGETAGQAAGAELGESMGQAVGRINSGPTFLKQRSLADYQANMQEFGGSLANRSAFPRRLLEAVLGAVGDQVAVLAKMNMRDGYRGGRAAHPAPASRAGKAPFALTLPLPPRVVPASTDCHRGMHRRC